jgi:hypothetical protein
MVTIYLHTSTSVAARREHGPAMAAYHMNQTRTVKLKSTAFGSVNVQVWVD